MRILMETSTGRNHGANHNFNSFTVSVTYGSTGRDTYVSPGFLERHKKLTKEFEDLLLNKMSKWELVAERYGAKETIVFPGDRISRLHLKTIKEKLLDIDFTHTPWAEALQKIKDQILRIALKEKIAAGDQQVVLKFVFDASRFKRAHKAALLEISAPVARWIAQSLAKAIDGKLPGECSITVVGDKKITATSE